MNSRIQRGAACIAAALAALVAAAPAAADVKVGGLVFGQYAHQLSDTNAAGTTGRNRGDFSISRIYLIGEAKFSPEFKAKIVLEGNTTGAGNAVFLKNAFGEYQFHENGSVTFGLIGTPWIGFEEGIWGRRFVEKVQTDLEKQLNSADKGVGLLGKFPGGYGDAHLVFVNGEGTTNNELGGESGRHKDGAIRVSLRPVPKLEGLAGLRLHGYFQKGKIQNGDNRVRDRAIGGVSYEPGWGHLMASYFSAKQGNGAMDVETEGYSVHGSVKLPKNSSVFARYDSTDPDSDIDDDAASRLIFGVDHKLFEGVRISLNDKILNREAETPAKADENQLYLQFEAKF